MYHKMYFPEASLILFTQIKFEYILKSFHFGNT